LILNISGILAVFTYDQAAAAVLVFLTYEAYNYLRDRFTPRVIKKRLFILQTAVLLSILFSYLFLINSRNGNGPGLSKEIFGRLFQNFVFLPVNVILQPSKFLFVGVVMIFAAIAIRSREKQIRFKTISNMFRIANTKYLVLAMAAYFPIAIWYVSPRHTYLPFIFFLIWSSQVFSNKNLLTEYRRKSWITASLVLSLLVGVTTVSLRETINESDYRSKVYIKINNSISDYKDEDICILISPLPINEAAFQHEYLNSALSFYSGSTKFISYDCPNPQKFVNLNNLECSQTNKLSSVIYLRFTEEEGSTKAEPRFFKSELCGVFEFSEIYGHRI
jgi:hypothetical protein